MYGYYKLLIECNNVAYLIVQSPIPWSSFKVISAILSKISVAYVSGLWLKVQAM